MPTGVYPADKCVAGVVEIYNKIIDNSDEIITVAEDMDLWQEAEVLFDDDNEVVDKNIRSNSVLYINADSAHPVFDKMNNIVRDYMQEYAENYDINFDYVENTQILKYPAEGYYSAHYDTSPNYPRVISALLYLNDVNYGGETEFTHFNIQIIPRSGRLVIFPSNYAYTHIAWPPQFGHKYVAVFWAKEITHNDDSIM